MSTAFDTPRRRLEFIFGETARQQQTFSYAHGNRARTLIALQRFTEYEADLNFIAELAKKDPGASLRAATRAQITRAKLLLAQGHALQARSQLDPLLATGREA